MNPSDRFVYVVAVDPLARGGLVAVLAAVPGWEVVGHSDPQGALQTLGVSSTEWPDVLLWDIGWSPAASLSDSLDWLRAAIHDFPTLPIVTLVESPESADPVWTLGVGGLLARSAPLDQLIAALDAVTTGLRVLSPHLLSQTTSRISPDDPLAAAITEPLTPREMDVLQLLAQGLPNKTIARELAISEHTVKFHMNSILGKLNAQSRTEAVVNAGRAGIIQV